MKNLYLRMFGIFMMLQYIHTVPAQVLVADYPFFGNAHDVSGFENHAAIRGSTLTTDRFGFARNAFSFDGMQSRLLAPNAAHLQSATLTVSFWVNVTSLPGQGEVFLLSHGGWQERWKISLPAHGRPVWTTNNTSGISDMDSGDGNELVPGVWTHLVMVHDGVEDRIYINGALANAKDVGGDLNPTGHPFGFGYDPIGGGNFFHGLLDDIQVYDAALSAQEIADLYATQSDVPVVGEGVVANYTFSGNVFDSSPFRNHGKSVDLIPTTDRFGFGNSAYAFDGISSSLTAANSAQLNSPATTVSFWINVFELPNQGEDYVASHGGWQERWKISLPAHGKLVWTTNHENGISDMDAGDGNELRSGVWTHVVMVHDGEKDKIYINGVQVADKDVVGDLNSTSHPLGLGYDPVGGGNYFNGSLDEFRIYNVALSDQEIADLYAEQSDGNVDPDPLVADYRFDGSAHDYSQFQNHAVSQGAVLVKDRFGYGSGAYYFDGNSSLIAANSPALNSDYTTVSFWVNVHNLPGNAESYLLSYGGWQERWKISLPTHGKVVWTTNHSGGISDMDAGDGNELVTGTWTHVVVVHAEDQDRIFINGALVASKDVGGTLNPTRHPLGIGYSNLDNDFYFDGELDQIQIYNRALTDEEIADLYAEQSAEPSFDEELVAEYTFSGNANDNTVFKNHGRATNTLLTNDRFGRSNHAYYFNGSSAEITADNSKQLNSPHTTVSFWVNVESLPAQGEVYLLSFGGWQERWKISLPGHGKPVWTTNYTGGISDMDSGDGNELVPGAWTHVVMVHDGQENKIYFNGALVASKDVAGDLNSTGHPLGMGYNAVDGGNHFHGYLDDIRIYNIALSDEEIADLYDEQSAEPIQIDFTPPTAPLDLEAEVHFTNVDLSWTASMDDFGVTGYNVFIDGAKVYTTESTDASFQNLVQLTWYEFGVSAVDAAGNESGISTLLVMTGTEEAPDTIPPTAPGNLQATTGANSVILSWDASTDNQAVAGYVVLVDGFLFDTLPPTQLSAFIGGLQSLTLYTFEVYAFDLAGNNSEFAEITVSTEAPVDTGEDGLVAHYPFEGNADDATPYENHGTLGGNPVFEPVTNRPNAAGMNIVFDGDGDHVVAPNAVQLISDYTTVAFWIRVDGQNFADPEAYILDFGHWDERWKISLPQHLKIVWTTNSKNMQFPNAISDMDAGDGNELVPGFWWYVTMVHDGEDDIVYLDGVEVNRKPAPGTLNATARPFTMGYTAITDGQYFIGALDEVKVYNKALTAEEILKLYQTGTTGVTDVNPELGRYIEIIYPNPANDLLTLRHRFNGSQDVHIRILDASGRQVDTFRFDREAVAAGQLSMKLGNYGSGMYLLNVIYGGKNLGALPFVKQ